MHTVHISQYFFLAILQYILYDRKEAGIKQLFESSDLKDMLKHWKKEDTTTQSAVLTGEQLLKFWKEAPNDAVYLPAKVISIFSVLGLLRRTNASLSRPVKQLSTRSLFLLAGYIDRNKGGQKWVTEGHMLLRIQLQDRFSR